MVKVMHRTATLNTKTGEIITDCNEQAVGELKRLRKLTKDYAKDYTNLFFKGEEVRECEICEAVAPTVNQSWQSGEQQVEKGEVEHHMDPAHLIEHMDQKQYPAALMGYAVDCFGAEWHKQKYDAFTGGSITKPNRHITYMQRDFPKLLRRFLRRELGLECSK